MRYRIWKSFSFSAAHQLTGLPPDHQCARMHGHNYAVEVELGSEDLNGIGFVRDFGELGSFKKWIDAFLDHRVLNDVIPEMNPTAENLAKYLYERVGVEFPEVCAVRVQETPTSIAEYRP